MSIVEVVLLAVGLSMDAFAVSVGKGLAMRRREHLQALALALAFGLFQGAMPLIGWFVGSRFAALISAVDHWIAFGLLAIVGARMLWDAAHPESDPAEVAVSPHLPWRELLVLAVATSIDAMAAGIGFAFLRLDIWLTVGLIAAITATLSYVGVVLGHQFGSRFERPAEVTGGLILIAIGAKILLEHLGMLGVSST